MRTILVVENEPTLIAVFVDAFTEEGYTVVCAAHGRDALALLAQTPVDLVLSGVRMPVMDGETLCRAIQADPRLQHIPVVLMSGSSTFHPGASCMPAAVVSKPFILDDLFRTVADLLSEPGTRVHYG